MTILLIEDDASAAWAVELVLKTNGYTVDRCDRGEDGMCLAKSSHYDLILLDMHLPDIHGLNVVTWLRNAGVATPILILSGETDVDMRVKTLRAGADDYLTKPFHNDELLARVRAVMRRAAASHVHSEIAIGELTLNLDNKWVTADGERLDLTKKEYQMLEALALRKGTVLTKSALLGQLYGGMDEPEAKIIDVFVCKLRKKLLKATHGNDYIKTVWGQGYQLEIPKASAA
jgi:two-component system cell cycle response regulator CtrA